MRLDEDKISLTVSFVTGLPSDLSGAGRGDGAEHDRGAIAACPKRAGAGGGMDAPSLTGQGAE